VADDRLIFEMSSPGRIGYTLPKLDVPDTPVDLLVPAEFRRSEPPVLPEVSEPEVVRHFTNISVLNHHVDRDFYPLGSCTMKYNPKVNDRAAALAGLGDLHPLAPEEACQGALALLHDLSTMLAEITGLPAVTLQPAAGAQGELVAMLMCRRYHLDRGQPERTTVIIPDSAHGTNPATVRIAGMKVVEIKSNEKGLVDLEALKRAVGPDTAAMMLTNPNTLGIFERDIVDIAKIVHDAGGLMYMDGANMNALAGQIRPGDMGFDMMHLNLHKTFSQPHGGGGPGAGPVCARADLLPYLPAPLVVKGDDGRFRLDFDRPKSVGRVHAHFGNFGALVRTTAYIWLLGREGVERMSRMAVVNANYLMKKLAPLYDLAYPGPCMHEFVLSGKKFKANGVRTGDIAKRILDFGMYAPTVYFPLIVEEALMIEPTESETKDTLDRFVEVMRTIAREAVEEPDTVKTAPHTTPVRRPDEGKAARELKLRWNPPVRNG
jgi:glycine dehydrogenase subunit 2